MKSTKSILSFTVVALLVATVANAQMTGGGRHQVGTPGNGQYGWMDEAMGAMGMDNHRGLVVGTDGTAYAVRVTNPTSTQAAAFEVVAVRTSGAIAWTASIDAGMSFVELSGDHLLVTTRPHGFASGHGQMPESVSSKVVALSTASGSIQWTLSLDGVAFDLEAFAGGTYVTVVKPAQPPVSGGMHRGGTDQVRYGARTLIAIGPDGKVLWSVALNN